MHVWEDVYVYKLSLVFCLQDAVSDTGMEADLIATNDFYRVLNSLDLRLNKNEVVWIWVIRLYSCMHEYTNMGWYLLEYK